MPRRGADKIAIGDLEKEILDKGRFTGSYPNVIDIGKEYNAGVYKYHSRIYVLLGGMDYSFDQIEEEDQWNILYKIEAGEYKMDKTFQV